MTARIRSGYSFRTAVGHLADVMACVKEIGLPAAPITDRNSTFAFNRWAKLAKENGLRPVFGVELAVTPQLGDKKPVLDWWTFIAKDNLRPLHDLVALATANPGKEPSLTYAQALAAPGVFKITGERVQLHHLTPQEDLYVGLSPSLPKATYKSAHAAGILFCAVADNVFPAENDKEFYRVTLGWRSGAQTYPQWVVSDDEWRRSVGWFADREIQDVALENRNKILESSTAQLKKATLLIPEKPATLRAMCEAGARAKGIDLSNPAYAARLKKELDLIAEKEFEDYFYIIADMVKWAKQRMVVGPARGSTCGSLACYLLGITEIDPIPFGLIFERFIDITRTDLPDADLDFSDERRQMVFDYVEQKYGRERVARLGTVGLFKPRSALNEVGKSLKVPRWQVERVLDGVIERSGGDSRALQQLEDTLTDTEAGRRLLAEYPEVKVAGRLEGHPNNASQHAAGIVLTQEPVAEYVAVDSRSKATMCDKKDAEDLNLLKIDALGLTQLSIFERALQLIGKPDRSGFLEKIPLDDSAAFDVLNKGHFAGVFQFMGGALQSLTKQITVSDIEDIISITALARPGPMASGGANLWVQRKTGRAQIDYPHPIFEPYLRDTLGIVMYQEQVMQIGREIGDLSWGDVTALRKAMSKSLGKEYFDQFGDRFKAAAVKKDVPPEALEKIWDDLTSFGSWAFNRSHSVAYGIVSYWTCWFKAHHPVEFAAATLDAEKEPMRQIALLRELAEEGIEYVPVDAEHSELRWTIKQQGANKVLVGPLTQIKGVGPATVREIMDARAAGRPLRATIRKKLEEAKTEIDTLFPVRDKVSTLHPDLSAVGIVTRPTNISKLQCGTFGDVVLIGVANKIAPKDENEAVNVAKRGYAFSGPTAALNLFMRDDTDEIFCKVNRFDFERLGREIVERGRAGKALYAIKGQVWSGFRGLGVKGVKFLGFMDD